jgi:hypothetical protein
LRGKRRGTQFDPRKVVIMIAGDSGCMIVKHFVVLLAKIVGKSTAGREYVRKPGVGNLRM